MAKEKEVSIAQVFQANAEKFTGKACVAYKQAGSWHDISWTRMNEMVHNLAFYLLSKGVKKGDRIGLFSPNRWEWWVADLAITSIGAVNVPIYATNSAEETLYILENSESCICFAGTSSHLEKILQYKKKLKKLKEVIIFDKYDKKTAGVTVMDEAMKKGTGYKSRGEFDKRLKVVKSDDLASILYTSGTTGNPKGVMLTHDNFYSDVRMSLDQGFRPLFTPEDVAVSFLPLSHSLEKTTGFYTVMAMGVKVAFAEDISKLMENFQEIRPTLIVSVPRIYEKVHAGILSKMTDAPALKKIIFKWATKVAQKNLPYECVMKPRTGLMAFQYNLADKLVFSKLKEMLGLNRIKFAISGGGPLAVSDAEFFIGMGLRICEGFGLTETTPVTNVNKYDHIKPGTVGPALPGTTVKIADDGEILIKGPQVMKGYYKNPRATKEVFTRDGFFKTGDIGRIDEDGFLVITGRIKDIIVTAGGKNISPQNIENSLKTSPYIEQVAIIGDRRKFLSALVIPTFEETAKWAKKKGLTFASRKEMIEHPEVTKLLSDEIKKYTAHFARVEQIRRFRLLDAEWTQATDELTPTQKVKRRVIETKYAEEIEALYAGDDD